MTALGVVDRPQPPPGPPHDRIRFQWGSLGLLTPAVALLVGLFLLPAGYAFYLGFTNLRLIGPTALHYRFTGSENLTTLAHDHTFYGSLELTGLFVVGSVVGTVVLGMVLALVMQNATRSIRIIAGGVVVVSWMMPAVTAGLAWYATTTAGGTLATLLDRTSSDFLHAAPLLVVTIANCWSQTGFAMLVFSAALRNVPSEVLEAATVENANVWQRYWRISLPIIWPTVVTTVLLVVLLSLGNFSLIYIMTQGGPGNATNILPVYSYQQAFSFQDLSYGALVGDAMVVLATIFAFIYVRVSRVRI
jgi:multiple sugar transport system permease protein